MIVDEADARTWLTNHVSRETFAKILIYEQRLRHCSVQQNLVSLATLDNLWVRHIVDSAQLVQHASAAGAWIDIGSGAGLPGVIVAIMRPAVTHLVEPRRLRAAFLTEVKAACDLPNVEIHAARIEHLQVASPAIISARAVASVDQILRWTFRLAAEGTRWILPRGRRATEELALVRRAWQGRFDLVPSLTDPEASVLVAENVLPRTGR